ncbi:MAG: glutamate formiminotransferase / formiminotetrahydrofolate cyclodeaminase [Spirochaetes bacterium]|nr:MAG: glutamate formiminotransferase / formiminotetrahydrofolate cyclodeaminase [Spirochaetota bacterium]
MKDHAIVECVPNFSEGKDQLVIQAIEAAIRSIPEVRLLGVDPGADTNRTVYSFAGPPDAVLDAALAAAKAASPLIDMRSHKGAHPRIGALDVCPFVPVSGITMEECSALAERFAQALAAELEIPVYLYDKSARHPARESLASIRSGEYEGLEAKLKDPAWKPDFGPVRFAPRWGATVTGAREFLIAYNINLNTRDKKQAHDIALSVREAGRTIRSADGSAVNKKGCLQAVRAIGWYIEEYGCAQVSINVLDYKKTPLHKVFETVKEEAEARGILVTGSELVGLIPEAALVECGRHFLVKMGKSPGLPLRIVVDTAVRSLGLSSIAPFVPSERIIEWAMKGKGELASKDLTGFADSVSADTPVPGGGSVSALAGALGASLAAMVANLTVGKATSTEDKEGMGLMALEAQALGGELMELVDQDTEAFASVLKAMRLPKISHAEQELRASALEKANILAASVPLRVSELCVRSMRLCLDAYAKGNPSSFADALVGSLLSFAGFHGAVLNVKVNLKSIRDGDFVARTKDSLTGLGARVESLEKEMSRLVEKADSPQG